MTDSDTVIGIDFISTDSDGGLYGLYESTDGGTHWKKLTESRTIFDLLQFAKDQYGSDTPMVLPQIIQQLLQYEFLTAREKQSLLTLHTPTEKPTKWYKRFLNWFRR